MGTGEPQTRYEPPGRHESFWLATTPGTDYPSLAEGVSVDVAILGGGIVGITSALLLRHAGLTVAVVEADRVVKGVTGHTTAKVTSLHRLIYHHLVSSMGKERAQQYADANQAALEKIASLVREYSIDCDFARKPAYTYADTSESVEMVREEVTAAKSLGLPASFVDSVPLPFETYGAVCFSNQAQFHPNKYLQALMQMIPGDGSCIFERTRALDIREGEPCVVRTDKGSLRARDVIVATHYPFYDRPGHYYAKMHPSRSYALGVRIREEFPDGMFINAEGQSRSLRSTPGVGGEIVIAAGERHKTGQGENTRNHYRRLEEFVRSAYDVQSIEYYWSSQDNITVDHIPYIGHLAGNTPHLYVGTGFMKWGMTNGTAAAMILSDLILGRKSRPPSVFDPSRFTPLTSAKDFITQGINVAGELIGGKLSRPAGSIAELAAGEGRIFEIENRKVAAYRDGAGAIHALDPTCMHMGCIVSWNDAEQTWDCPCHGSRYTIEGEVVHGPTVQGLKRLKVERKGGEPER
ncbi:MAG: FAD-dependent oxidoreductase [Methanomicrobiaceae archaeon]|uniref:Rieske domain-containing protein n=1 Tax=hydrocarbon metagenome TaxID=938273 RepID=A0A0W8FKG2_9ZZZZ|nr:FAD-dependent oxidoreductase [Methanomicrobiaceae archaeon]MDD5420453.1 FAD-dependent oxidoreductase [Methanomicrobiaceae archaeon]